MKGFRLIINGSLFDEYETYEEAYYEGLRLNYIGGVKFKVKNMRLRDRIKAKTSVKNRVQGITATGVATICTAVLATGAVTNPVGVVLLTIGAGLGALKARHHALKVGEDKTELK